MRPSRNPIPHAIVTFTTLAFVGCAGSGSQKTTSPYPPDRAGAAVRLAESGNRDSIHTLVNLLEDPDAGVRLYAILALERLCGTTHGYRYYDAVEQRDAAVARWRSALREGTTLAAPAGDPLETRRDLNSERGVTP